MTNEPLILNVDYTIENGLYVFTAHYLKKRGYCCESGCRNCPYGFRKPEDAKKPERDQRNDT